MLVYLAVYDISNDRKRTKFAETLIEFGFYRIQKSVFLGLAKEYDKETLIRKAKKLLEGHDKNQEDSFYMIQIAASKIEKMDIIGQKPELDLILRKKSTLII